VIRRVVPFRSPESSCTFACGSVPSTARVRRSIHLVETFPKQFLHTPGRTLSRALSAAEHVLLQLSRREVYDHGRLNAT